MAEARRQQLNTSVHGTASAAGTLTLRLGPSTGGRGPAYWNVTRLQVRNQSAARRGRPPIPTCNVYLDSEDANGLVDGTYDGSFDFSECDLDLSRGQELIAVWSGEQSGDVLELAVTGWKE